MGLDPTLEKAGRYGQLHRIPFAAVELHASEPARVNIVADFGAETISHPRPAVLIHARHFVCLLFLIGINGWVQRGRNAILPGRHTGGHEATRTQATRGKKGRGFSAEDECVRNAKDTGLGRSMRRRSRTSHSSDEM